MPFFKEKVIFPLEYVLSIKGVVLCYLIKSSFCDSDLWMKLKCIHENKFQE
jgi:hypothetical protein